MTYLVEIRCDRQKGDPLTKRECASRKGMRASVPITECATASEASRLAERRAKASGWIKKKQPGRNPSVAWICPTCQEGEKRS